MLCVSVNNYMPVATSHLGHFICALWKCKRRRPQLRWEDCVRDLRKVKDEEKWREKANNRDQWEQTTKVPYLGVTTRPASPIHKRNQAKNKIVIFCDKCSSDHVL